MTVITTRISVSLDGAISTTPVLPAGDYIASVEMRDAPPRPLPAEPFDVDDLRVNDFGPWLKGFSLRREDMYGDDGR